MDEKMIDELGLTQSLKAFAKGVGFDKVRAASVESLSREEHRVNEWVGLGFAADMDYMKRFSERLARLRLSFPQARSVVALAIQYPSALGHADDKESGEGARGRVARYAWGRDYHKVVIKKLELVADFLKEHSSDPIEVKPYVDTGPLLERSIAEQSGMGFLGKNTTLILPEQGSWFFLAELLTDARLEYDQPMGGAVKEKEKSFFGCGNCTLCLQACPTGALTDPYQLDAGRCISYLTIENRGAIPGNLRQSMGDWVFGCDLCLEVCPYNKKAREPKFAELGPEHGAGPHVSLQEILTIRNDKEFSDKFAGTALMRAKRTGVLRNAAVASGNSRDRSLVQPLAELLRADTEPIVRGHAAWALGQIGGQEALDELKKNLESEQDQGVKQEIQKALEKIKV